MKSINKTKVSPVFARRIIHRFFRLKLAAVNKSAFEKEKNFRSRQKNFTDDHEAA